MKATAQAHPNTALIKYWGKKDEKRIIPMNNSISVTTDSLTTTTTVEFNTNYEMDIFYLNGTKQTGKRLKRVIDHLDLIRSIANDNRYAKVFSQNSFPMDAGLASSASGFAALTVAACKSLDLRKTKQELSMISRQGSGSSTRSIYGGFVEWLQKGENDQSYAIQLADKDWFEICDIIVVLEPTERIMNTRQAMRVSKQTSPFYENRLEEVEDNLELIREAIRNRDFKQLGETAEKDCLLMHAVALTSSPTLLFWTPATIKIIQQVQQMRENGLQAFYTIDTGANMHILTLPEYEKEILNQLDSLKEIQQLISSRPGDGAHIINNHLF